MLSDLTSFNAAPCGLVVLDPDLTVIAANPYFLRMIGERSVEPEGQKFHSFFTVASRIFIQTRLQQELALSGHCEELALDIAMSNGARLPVMLNAAQTLRPDGRLDVIQIAILGAAAKRAYEAEVPKARAAALEAARVKADFLANISHEMRTPLNGVLGVAELLANTELTGPQQDMVQLIAGSSAVLERLLSDVLDLALIQAGDLTLQPTEFDLLQELASVIELTRLQGEEKGLDVSVEADPSVHGRYLGDPVRLRQVLSHLTSNALKFTESGRIGMSLSYDAGRHLIVAVDDTGVGFDESKAEELFEHFSQAESGATRRYGGTGSGLALSKAVVELMGGQIKVRSNIGVGSCFTVLVPLEQIESVVAPEDRADEPASGRALRILLVEDNPTNQKVVTLIMEAYGVELAIADNGQLGVDAWAAEPFDLVLMDLQMPVMDGLTAIRTIRQREASEPLRERTPIIVLSANAMAHHKAEAIEAGADQHLAKPVSPAGLIGAIDGLLTSIDADPSERLMAYP